MENQPFHARLPEEALQHIRRLLAEKKKIAAIKIYREVTNAGLAQAKMAVEAIERGELLATMPAGSPFESKVVELLQQGKKIPAIAIYRQHTGASLKQSKDFIEALIADGRIPGVTAQRGCLGVLLVALLAGLAASSALAMIVSRFG